MTELMECASDAGSSKPDIIPAVSHVDMAPGTPPIKPGGGRRSRSRSRRPKSLYLLYNHFPYPTSSWSNSFYKIDIPYPKDSYSGPREITMVESESLLSPMLEMKANNTLFTKDMKCARLGSKVYFLGGQLANNFNIPATDSESKLDLDKAKSLLFPRDVYVMDLARGDKEIDIQKLDAQLNCGKPDPCVFAAEGKLYALGSAIVMNIRLDFLGLYASMSGKMFERYDPGVGEWEVLDDPPVDGLQWISDFTVILERHGLVLFKGLDWQGRLLYDLRHDKWVSISPDLFTLSVAAVQPHSYGYALYGINGFGSPMKLKQLLQVQEQEKEDGIQSTLSLIGGGSKYDYLSIDILNCDKELILFGDPYIDSVIQLHSLGDGYFCRVVVGDLPRPEGRDLYGYIPSDPCSRAFKITVFKEIFHDGIIHSPITAAAECESSFQVQVLYSQEYVIRTPSYSKGSLVSSFVLSQVQEQKMKKKMKRCMKKNNKEATD